MEIKRPRENSQLIQFSELKEAVIANVVKNVPSAAKSKDLKAQEKSLLEFD